MRGANATNLPNSKGSDDWPAAVSLATCTGEATGGGGAGTGAGIVWEARGRVELGGEYCWACGDAMLDVDGFIRPLGMELNVATGFCAQIDRAMWLQSTSNAVFATVVNCQHGMTLTVQRYPAAREISSSGTHMLSHFYLNALGRVGRAISESRRGSGPRLCNCSRDGHGRWLAIGQRDHLGGRRQVIGPRAVGSCRCVRPGILIGRRERVALGPSS